MIAYAIFFFFLEGGGVVSIIRVLCSMIVPQTLF